MLKEFLKENKIEFEDINVQENQGAAMEMIEKAGKGASCLHYRAGDEW